MANAGNFFVLADALIAPAFPSNTARGGVLYPVVLSVAAGSSSRPDDPEGRRLGACLMFCGMALLAVFLVVGTTWILLITG